MSNSLPLVSVVLPVYNGANTISKAIESVLNQTVPLELLVIDDGSVDDSIKVVQSYSNVDSRVKFIPMSENQGVAEARNKGLECSQGKYIAFIDADDCWHKNKLLLQISQMEENNWKLSYTTFKRVSDSGKLINIITPRKRASYNNMLLNNSIATSTACIIADVGKNLRFRKIGHEDYVFWMNSLKQIDFAYCVVSDMPLVEYTVSKNSLSANKLKAILWQWKNYRYNLELPLVKSVYCFSVYVFLAVFKRFTG